MNRSDTDMDKYVIEVTASEVVTIAADFQKMQDIYGDEGRTDYWEADDIARNIAQWFGERITSAIQNQEGIRKV